MCEAANLRGVSCGSDARLSKPWKSNVFLCGFCHCHDKNLLLVDGERCETATYLLHSSSDLGCWAC